MSARDETPTIAQITLATDSSSWAAAGFRLDGAAAQVGRVRLRFVGQAERPRIRWALRSLASLELDGLPTERSDEPLPDAAPPHPNGVERLDHVVAFSGDLERTVSSLKAAGLDFRRLREGATPAGSRRQAFFRLGETLLEVVEHPPDAAASKDAGAPSRLWGLAFAVGDIEATARALGDRLGTVRDAVQPGRRIATVARDAGLRRAGRVHHARPCSG